MTPFTLRRTNTETGVEFEASCASLHEAERSVAWCAADNLGRTRQVASADARRAGEAFRAGDPFVLGHYHFVVALCSGCAISDRHQTRVGESLSTEPDSLSLGRVETALDQGLERAETGDMTRKRDA